MGVQIDQAGQYQAIRRIDPSMRIERLNVAHSDDASVVNGDAGSLVD